MLQDWRHLLFLHWAVAPDHLREVLPPGLTLDLFQGRAYVGLIPFTIKNSRPPVRFHEVNVRTYVQREGRPGVYFFSLDAASRSAVIAARTLYKLPYHFARIDMTVVDDRVEYRSERQWPKPLPATCSIQYRLPETPLRAADPGTVEHFLIERYRLYTFSGGELYEVTVEHEPYRIQKAEVGRLEETLVWAAGLRKLEDSPLAHYATGLHVGISSLKRSAA